MATSPHRLLYDEACFANNIPRLHQYGFGQKFLNSLTRPTGPLYSFVHVVFEPITQLRPVRMRFVNVFLLVLLAGVLAAWLERQRQSDYWVVGCSVLVVPMTWVVAGMALSEMSAMVFVTLSLYLQLRGLEALKAGRPVRGWLFASGVCLGIAVWGRQPYLLLCGIPVLAAVLDRRLRMAAVIFVGVVLAMAIPLFMIWRALVPPSSHEAQQGISVTNGLTSLAYTGICFLLVAPRSRWLPVKVLLGLVALSIVANMSLGALVLYPIKSVIDRHLPVSMVSLYGSICGSLFLSCGVVFLAVLLRMICVDLKDLSRVTVSGGLLCLAISPMFISHQYSSRYTAMSLPYLILAAQPWRRWGLETVIAAVLGCGVGFLSLFGYFSSLGSFCSPVPPLSLGLLTAQNVLTFGNLIWMRLL